MEFIINIKVKGIYCDDCRFFVESGYEGPRNYCILFEKVLKQRRTGDAFDDNDFEVYRCKKCIGIFG